MTMRDYAVTRAATESSLALTLSGLIENWRARREAVRLLSADERDLGALGLTREDVRWAMTLPYRDNLRLALEDRSFHRARRDADRTQ
jgi:uncharacterized protein YjiS (DUF1127 family)